MPLHDGADAYTGPDADDADRPTSVYAPPPGDSTLRPPPMPSDVAPYASRPPTSPRTAMLAALIVFPWSLVVLGAAAYVHDYAAIEAATRDVAVVRVYVPRCAPAFAGRGWACVDGAVSR